jgi:hypothetical protein
MTEAEQQSLIITYSILSVFIYVWSPLMLGLVVDFTELFTDRHYKPSKLFITLYLILAPITFIMSIFYIFGGMFWITVCDFYKTWYD